MHPRLGRSMSNRNRCPDSSPMRQHPYDTTNATSHKRYRLHCSYHRLPSLPNPLLQHSDRLYHQISMLSQHSLTSADQHLPWLQHLRFLLLSLYLRPERRLSALPSSKTLQIKSFYSYYSKNCSLYDNFKKSGTKLQKKSHICK